MKSFLPRKVFVSWQWMAWSVFALCLLAPLHVAEGQVRVEAIFNQGGVRGKIDFYQESSSSPTRITVNLTGLPSATFPWYVHQYPFPLDALPNPCGTANIGGVYSPNGVGIGGRLSNSGFLDVSDNLISGIYSIIGRSIVLFENSSSPLVCANIDYPASSSATELLYVPFREGFAGNVYFRQYGSTVASVYTDLSSLGFPADSVGHNWHVHNASLGNDRSDCNAAGPHYNPRNAVVLSQFYMDFCNPTNQTNCEVGDLSNKGAPLDVVGGVVRQFYTDTDLTLAGAEIFITGRSVVIHAADRGGMRIACANISVFYSLEAEAVFSSGVSGRITFNQRSPFDSTRVTVNLVGLNGRAGGYHVHVYPVGPADVGFPGRCGGVYTGGHWNPLNANYTAQTPSTSDQFEVGDLSGKFGSLAGRTSIDETYWDPNVPLFGSFGIIGRSIVIHESDGTRWYCANIVHTRPVATFSYTVNTTSVEGSVTMSQFIDDPYSPTTIVVILRVKAPLQPPAVSSSSTPVVSSSSLTPMLSSSTTPVLSLSSTPMLTSSPGMTTSLPQFPTSAPTSTSGTTTSASSPSLAPTPTPAVSSPSPPEASSVPEAFSSVLPVASSPAMSSSSSQTLSSASMPLIASPSSLSSPSVTMPLAPSTSSIDSPSLLITTSSNLQLPDSTLLPSDGVVPTTSTSVLSSERTGSSTLTETLPITTTAVPSESAILISPTPSMPMTRRRRSLPQPIRSRERRQAMAGGVFPFDWSLRSASGGSGVSLADCPNLPVAGDAPQDPALCSRDMPLACSAGDLTAKHGTLNLPLDAGSMLRMVFTDSNLPLTGPLSPFSPTSPPVLLVQPMNGGSQTSDVACASAVYNPPTNPATPPTTSPGATGTDGTASEPPPSNSAIGPIIGGVVAAVVVAAVVVLLILVLCCVCKGRRSKYDLQKSAELEMGVKIPSKPVLGVPNYRVLHPYEPQNEGDLALQAGDWVTLEETPYGGGWWRGAVDDRTGWFPKTYVEYVDRDAERKRKQEESFTLAAAAIMDASSTFSSRHPSQSIIKRGKSDAGSERVAKKRKGNETQRRHTFSRKEIDSTPKMVTKFDKPYLERGDITATIIENATKDASLSGSSCPETPKSIRNNEIIANTQAEDSENSQPDNDDIELTKAMLEGGDLTEDVVVHAEKYAARYDFRGTSDIELDFTSGSVILVIEKADNGWWRGIHKGQLGWFPESYMSPESLGKTNLISKFSEGDSEGGNKTVDPAAGNEVERPKNMDETMANEEGDLEASEYCAICTYPSEMEGDLAFNEGDTVWVYWGQDNGWWFGSAGGLQGWFPESYVEPIIDISTAPAEADEPAALNDEGDAAGKTSSLPAAQEEAAVEESKDEDGRLSKMKERSKSPPSMVEAEETGGVEKTQRDVTTGQDGPMVAIATVVGDNKISSAEESRVASKTPPSVTEQINKKTEQVPDDASKNTVQDTPTDTPTGTAALTEATKDSPVLDKRNSPTEDKELLLPKADNKPIEKNPKPAVRTEHHPTPSGRSRRRPPPPPSSTGPRAIPPTVQEEAPSDVSQSPLISSRKSDTALLLTPREKSKTKPPKPTSPTKTVPPTVVEKLDPESPAQSPAFTSRKSDTAPLLKTAAMPNKSKPGVAKASTIARPRQTVSASKNPVSELKQKPQRRTTTVDNRTKPRRRPPPPAPAALLQATATPSKSQEETKQAPSHATVTPSSTPIPPPRAKARMKKVKRPTGRMIPPPPRIPLPPPPSVKKTATPTVATKTAHPLATSNKGPPLEQTGPSSSPTATTPGASSNASPVSSVPSRVSNEGAVTPRGMPKGPRPPPPKRISSLHPVSLSPQVATRTEKKPDGFQQIQEAEQETAAKPAVDAVSKKTDDSKVPPKRPPPPRPGNPPSNRHSNPPTAEPPALPSHLQSGSSEAAEAGAPVATRGSTFMGSLKRMVRRDSKKSPRGSRKDSQSKPERPAQLPQKRLSVNEAQGQSPVHAQRVLEPPVAQSTPGTDESPVPKPRTKKPMKSGMSDPDISVTTLKQEPPARPSQPPNVPQQPQQSSASDAPVKISDEENSVPNATEGPIKDSSDDKPATSPSSVSSREEGSPAAASAPLQTQPNRTFVSSDSNPFPKPQAPKRLARTSTSSNRSTSNATTSDFRTSVVSSPVETSSPAPIENRRWSSNIPAKPPPPVTVSKAAQKPKPPIAPKPSTSSPPPVALKPSTPSPPPGAPKPSTPSPPPIAPKPSTPSPHTTTGTKSFQMPTNYSHDASTKEASSESVTSKQVEEDTNLSSFDEDSPPVNFYRASKTYDSKSSEELSLAEGDTVMFIEKKGNGFYYGMKDDGNTGLFPVSCVKPFLK